MADEQEAQQGAGEAGGDDTKAGKVQPRRELEGFQVTRARAPAEQGPPVMAFVVVILVLAGLGFAGYTLANKTPDPAKGGGPNGTGKIAAQPDFPPDAAVEDFVWERIEFLESEGNLETALSFAEEQNELSPHSQLRAKIAALRNELGITDKARTLEEILKDAESHLQNDRFQQAYDDADEALGLDEENATAYYLRGAASGKLDDKASALSDLGTAIEMGYPEEKARALIKQYEN